MSAGDGSGNLKVDRDLSKLAPRFRAAVENAVAACKAKGLDVWVYEGMRSEALQVYYYAKGRTIIPPRHTVTNAATALYSWHGYGLAIDVIHSTRYWEPDGGLGWFRQVAEVFKQHGCKWGGDWTKPDPPHFQWHLCRPSPSIAARHLLATGGLEAVWKVVDAA